MEEIVEGKEEATESTVAWRFKEQELCGFIEDLGYALEGLGAVLFGLTPTSYTGEVIIKPKGLIFLSQVAETLAMEALAAYSYHANHNQTA